MSCSAGPIRWAGVFAVASTVGLTPSTMGLTPRAPARMSASPGGAMEAEGAGMFEVFEASFDGQRSRQLSAFSRPATSDSLRSYLLGTWALKKVTLYKVGGISGRFEGSCVFESFFDPRRGKNDPLHERGLLAYSEVGHFRPDEDSSQVLETRNRLMYDVSNPTRIDVFFDDSHDRSAEQVLAGLRFDHSLSPETLQMAEATPAPGLNTMAAYSGQLDIEAPHAFISTWGVRGDTLDGVILSMFSKR
jgi:hypothetical protein